MEKILDQLRWIMYGAVFGCIIGMSIGQLLGMKRLSNAFRRQARKRDLKIKAGEETISIDTLLLDARGEFTIDKRAQRHLIATFLFLTAIWIAIGVIFLLIR